MGKDLRIPRSISMPASAWAKLDAHCKRAKLSRGRWVEAAIESVCSDAPEDCEVRDAP